MKIQHICALMVLASLSSWSIAKTSWGVSVGIPVVQQSTINYQVQHIPPTATAIDPHQQARIQSVSNYGQNNVIASPYRVMSAQEYQNYRYYNAYPPVVYAPAVVYTQPVTQVISQSNQGNIQQTTIVQQSQLPAMVHLRIGDVVPQQYRQVNYWVNDWQRYRLASPPAGHLWVNINGQFALVSQPDYLIIRLGN